MNISPSRNKYYAIALFNIAFKDKITSIEKYKEEIINLNDIFEKNIKLINILNDKTINLNHRYKLIDDIFFNFYNITIIIYLKILIKNNCLKNYNYIFNYFINLCNNKKCLIGTIYSTIYLQKDEINKLELIFKKINKIENVKLINKIDNSLIGGIKIIINDKVYDYSILHEINLLKKIL